ncbi:hypothetical protein ABH926_008919 [Catenulispora sp. GP43]
MPEWADLVRRGQCDGPKDADLAREVAALGEWSFASRRLVSCYLTWTFEEIRRRLPAAVTLRVVQDKVTDVSDSETGSQVVTLASGEIIETDAVVLATGHLDAEPLPWESSLRQFATKHGLLYIPPAYSADVDLAGIQPGETVVMRGLGLAFVDFTAMLTEGRGGRYEKRPDGRLTYVPSGEEPFIVAGSRRGVPHHCKPNYRLTGDRAILPRFVNANRLAAVSTMSDYARDIDPLVRKEIAWAYYHELLRHHPERCSITLEEFEERFAPLQWATEDMDCLIAEAVPNPRDRFDFDYATSPLGPASYNPDVLQRRVRAYVEADLERRLDATYSADMGVVHAVESVLEQLTLPACLSRLKPRDVRYEIDGHLTSLAKETGSGPPPDRLRQLVALSEAGIVRFLGAGMWVEEDDAPGLFRAGSASSPETFEARTVVEARLPGATVKRTMDPLLRALYSRGEAVEQSLSGETETYDRGPLMVEPSDGKMILAGGQKHPSRYALGPYTSAGSVASFIVPGRNSAILRQNDAVARRLLTSLLDQTSTLNEEKVLWSSHEPDLDRRPAVGTPGVA